MSSDEMKSEKDAKRAEYMREWRRNNPDKVREYRRRYNEKVIERRAYLLAAALLLCEGGKAPES